MSVRGVARCWVAAMVIAAAVLTTGCGAEPAPAGALPVFTGVPRDVVVDTDLGADDAIALVYLLRRRRCGCVR